MSPSDRFEFSQRLLDLEARRSILLLDTQYVLETLTSMQNRKFKGKERQVLGLARLLNDMSQAGLTLSEDIKKVIDQLDP